MANNNFNTAEFLRGAYFSPIELGAHTVTLGRVKTVIETKDDNTDGSYLLVPINFNNGRKVDVRFYGIGAKIFCDQIRQQLGDDTDYNKLVDFLKTLTEKSVSVWISKRTYTANDGKVKTTLQYDFVEPDEATTPTSAEPAEPAELPFG